MKKFIICLFCLWVNFSFAATPALQKLTVVLDWFPNPDHAPLIIADQQGFFKEEGLAVELLSPADPTDAAKLVSARRADIGITYEPEFMEQVDRGLPLIRIGTLIDKPLDCIVTLKESGIKSIGDLKGKRIGSANSNLAQPMLKTLLENNGVSLKDVELITVRYNLTQALLSHKVDAVTGIMRNFEVPQLELTGHNVTAFFPEEHGVPNYSVLIFITHTNNVKDKRLLHFLTAIKKAVAYLDDHPKQTWEQFAKKYPESNNKVNHEAWFATIPYFAEDPAYFNKGEWIHFANFMHQHQMIKKPQPVSRYAINLNINEHINGKA